MVRNVYTYIRIILTVMLLLFFFLDVETVRYQFLFSLALYTISIPLKRVIKMDVSESFSFFERKLNYFLDEFYVYGAVTLLSLYGFAPLWVVIIYFFKDATIGAVRNFAIKNDEELHERSGYQIDKIIQYSVIFMATLCFSTICRTSTGALCPAPDKMVIWLFYFSAAVSASTLIIFFFRNIDFMKKIHNS